MDGENNYKNKKKLGLLFPFPVFEVDNNIPVKHHKLENNSIKLL